MTAAERRVAENAHMRDLLARAVTARHDADAVTCAVRALQDGAPPAVVVRSFGARVRGRRGWEHFGGDGEGETA